MSTVFADPLSPPAFPAAESARPRRRWEIWRSPDGQPSWARPVLLAIAALAAALYAWNIANAGLAPFYSVAVKSMSESWKAFFYGAYDPKATITIDKLAGSFLPQALSARIFGFHAWSLALPQVIEGVVSVLAMYRAVRRWAGAAPGLVAALIFALTPIAASMFGHSMEDGALTMCLVLAADMWTTAVVEGRLRSLLWAGFWIGVGFQAKMLQAWMVLPALIIGYLLCAPGSWLRRVRDLLVFGVVTLGVSLSWILLYTFTPAADRPYVDGSTNNSAWSMVFGYNGLERFGISVPGAVTSGPGVTTGGGSSGFGSLPSGVSSSAEEIIRQVAGSGGSRGGGGTSGFGSGWTKLLGSEFGPQIGWLFPLAVITLVCGILWTWRTRRDDRERAGFVMWGLSLLTYGLIFSDMSSIPHTAYVASLAPAVAALSGAGIVMFWRLYRAGDRRGWMLPVSVVVSLAWAIFLWHSYSGFMSWALWAAVVVGVIAVAIMVHARPWSAAAARRIETGRHEARRFGVRLVTVGLVAGVFAMLAAPSTWAASVLDSKYAGSSFNASAGPEAGTGGSGGGLGGAPAGSSSTSGGSSSAPGGTTDSAPGGAPAGSGSAPGGSSSAPGGTTDSAPGGARGEGSFAGASGGLGGSGGTGSGMMGATESLSTSERQIYDYVSAHRGSASYLMAVESWTEASPYILSTGQEVMPMGGFSGTVPEPTLAQVQQLVHSGQLKFFLLSSAGGSSGSGGPGAGQGGSSSLTAIESWVKKACTAVPAKDYGGTMSSSSTSGSAGLGGGAETLYVCKG
jgi:4-amino-4-deoxy-L-arabinose transferase-like glycosyltransferase